MTFYAAEAATSYQNYSDSPLLLLIAVCVVALAGLIIIWRQTSGGSPDNPSPTRVALVGAIIVGLTAGVIGAYLLNAGWAN
jgi:hypothetical protein